MDDNTLEAVKYLADLAETFNNQGMTGGRDEVLQIIANLISRVQPKPQGVV